MVRDMLSIAAILLAAACLVYTALKRDRSVTTYALCAALAATSALEAFDLLSLLYPADFFFWKKAALLSEALLPPTWLLFSLTFSRRVEPNSLSLLQRTLAGLSPVFLAAALFITTREFFNSPDFPAERMLFLGDPGFAFYLGILIYMTASLVNLENTLLTTSRAARWSIKFEVLGAGALIAVLIFYYSQGLLYRSINMDLIPVRSIVMIVAAAFMAYSVLKRGKGIKAKVYVSKQMAYRSVVVFIVGLYLIGLGLIGEGMRYFGGGSAQKVMLISIGFISGIGLVVLLLSETVKRKIKVVLHKNFYTNKYDYRVQWLQFTDRLSCSKTGEDLLKAILAGFCDTFGMGGAMLFLREGGKGALRHAVSFETDPVDRVFSGDSALVRFMKTKRRIFYAKDHTPEVMKEDGDFFREYGISFAVPLYVNDEVEGFIALGRS
ncbi:MAG TPA: histidine kinase N-terminal 7TM domain-containing protein, partial [Dissulfurispiraceae bacterium]